jgi:TetR/AcrR family transcriptional repressor of lmrAB and yxaGH operons
VSRKPGNSLRARQRAFARAQFLEEGLRLFDERGYAQTTIEELASRCGCAKGTIYAHFPDGKDELVRAVYRSIGEDFDRELEALLETRGDDVLACVDAVAELLMAISAEPAKGRFFMFSAPALPSVLGDALGRTGRGIIGHIADRIRAAQAAGEIDAALDADHVGQLILGLLREAGIRIAGGDASEAELKAALHALLTGALVGHPPRLPDASGRASA